MIPLNSILVVISGKRGRHAALERALKFAQFNDIHIHLFNSIYEPIMDLTDVISSAHRKELKKEFLSDRTLYMESVAKDLREKGIDCSVKVTWHRELHEAVEEAAIELQPDLVIKRITEDEFTLNPFAMPVDSHLLRYCPVPLLLVNKSSWAPGPVLAALDPTTDDKDHVALNHQILNHAKTLAQLYETDVHAVNTFDTPVIGSSLGLADFDYSRLQDATRQWHKNKMLAFLEEHPLDEENIHLVESSAEIGISKVANDIEAQVVIIGTVGRTGLSAAFIGNTAERVLSKLNCEVLTIKPEVP